MEVICLLFKTSHKLLQFFISKFQISIFIELLQMIFFPLVKWGQIGTASLKRAISKLKYKIALYILCSINCNSGQSGSIVSKNIALISVAVVGRTTTIGRCSWNELIRAHKNVGKNPTGIAKVLMHQKNIKMFSSWIVLLKAFQDNWMQLHLQRFLFLRAHCQP